MSQPLFFSGGQFSLGTPAISVADAGFVFGATATDLIRTFQHRLDRLSDHLIRFRESCRLCRIPLEHGDDELRSAAERLVEHNTQRIRANEELALILLATPGTLGHYCGRTESGPPTVILYTIPLLFSRYRRLFSEGASLVIPQTRALPIECVAPRAKMRSRMHWWIAEQQAREIDPGSMALLVDSQGYITETASANILLVRDGRVVSPPQQMILNGISLSIVRELCELLGIAFEERKLTQMDCQSADEAMLSCTSFCLAGVQRIDSVQLPWPGPVFRRLLNAWSKRVGVDIERQFLD